MCIHVFHIVLSIRVIVIHSSADCLYQFYTCSALFLGARPLWVFSCVPLAVRGPTALAPLARDIIYPSTQAWKLMLVCLAGKYMKESLMLLTKTFFFLF